MTHYTLGSHVSRAADGSLDKGHCGSLRNPKGQQKHNHASILWHVEIHQMHFETVCTGRALLQLAVRMKHDWSGGKMVFHGSPASQ